MTYILPPGFDDWKCSEPEPPRVEDEEHSGDEYYDWCDCSHCTAVREGMAEDDNADLDDDPKRDDA